MTIEEIRSQVTSRLPARIERLQLTFYGERLLHTGDSVVIGDDYGTELRVRLENGSVVSIDTEGQLPERFVNSSIEQLADFLQIYQSYFGRAKSEVDLARIAKQMRSEMAALDPQVFDDDENWWAVVLEQSEDGLL